MSRRNLNTLMMPVALKIASKEWPAPLSLVCHRLVTDWAAVTLWHGQLLYCPLHRYWKERHLPHHHHHLALGISKIFRNIAIILHPLTMESKPSPSPLQLIQAQGHLYLFLCIQASTQVPHNTSSLASRFPVRLHTFLGLYLHQSPLLLFMATPQWRLLSPPRHQRVIVPLLLELLAL